MHVIVIKTVYSYALYKCIVVQKQDCSFDTISNVNVYFMAMNSKLSAWQKNLFEFCRYVLILLEEYS